MKHDKKPSVYDNRFLVYCDNRWPRTTYWGLLLLVLPLLPVFAVMWCFKNVDPDDIRCG